MIVMPARLLGGGVLFFNNPDVLCFGRDYR